MRAGEEVSRRSTSSIARAALTDHHDPLSSNPWHLDEGAGKQAGGDAGRVDGHVVAVRLGEGATCLKASVGKNLGQEGARDSEPKEAVRARKKWAEVSIWPLSSPCRCALPALTLPCT